ncbi:9106_t:CDS:2 [Cetraspora pellucida]|uniref:9106_t:CDS:1 n=1 Tax=Cetraspora pellucida TaxID=1433469 RepID=A0ACA9JVS0_9GLOM|nr:9106_t:CDS:2 [Cetraspora pellucida]
MDDSGEIRIGHKPDFCVKSPLIAGEVEICLMEASCVLSTDKKICDDWDKLIKLMKDAHMRLLRKLTRGRVGDVKEIEENLNRVPVFGIQVAGGTMACWVMTMPFGAFYFVQCLGSVQIPMNRGQSSLAGFMDELWKLRIVEKVDASLYNIAFCSPQAREDVSLYDESLRELNSRLLSDIDKLRKKNDNVIAENIKLKAKNIKLKQSLEEHESRFIKLEQNDKDTTSENAELKARVAKLKQNQSQNNEEKSNSNITKIKNSNDTSKQIDVQTEDVLTSDISDITSNSDIHQKSSSQPETGSYKNSTLLTCTEIKSSEDKEKKLQEQKASLTPLSDSLQNHITEISARAPLPKNSHRKKGAESISQMISDGIQNDTYRSTLSSSNDILLQQSQISSTVPLLTLAQLFNRVTDAEYGAIHANQEEILCWCYYGKEFITQVNKTIKNRKVGKKKVKGIIYDKMLEDLSILCKKRSEDTGLQLPEISCKYLQGKTQKAVKIYKLFENLGIDKIKYITTYSANSISELTNNKIKEIIDSFSKQEDESLTPENSSKAFCQNQKNTISEDNKSSSNTEISIPTESQISDSSSSESTQENNQVETKARNSASTKLPEAEVSISTSSHLVSASDNKSRPSISILPDDPEEKRKSVIDKVLKQFPYLSSKYSRPERTTLKGHKNYDYFDFNSSVFCPICNKDYKKENIRDNIKGEWGSGDYVNTRTYRLQCCEAYQNSIQIVMVKA